MVIPHKPLMNGLLDLERHARERLIVCPQAC
jgi:hypothetical protein